MGGDAKKRRDKKTRRDSIVPIPDRELHWVAWDGIGLLVPEDWDLGYVTGTGKNGYLRIDDTRKARIEIKWRKMVREVDIERFVKRYIWELQQRAKREKVELKIARDQEPGVVEALGRDVVLQSFRWTADNDALGAILQCRECGRVVHIQFIVDQDFPFEHANQLLGTLVDHPDQGWTLWSVYGFEFETPEEFKLETHDLRAGIIQMRFGARHGRLVIRRIGLANVALKDTTLSQWVQDQFARQGGPEYRRLEVLPIQGPVGETVKFTARMAVPVRPKLASHKPVTGRAWHCAECNRIYSVALEGANAGEETLEMVAQKMICHRSENQRL